MPGNEFPLSAVEPADAHERFQTRRGDWFLRAGSRRPDIDDWHYFQSLIDAGSLSVNSSRRYPPEFSNQAFVRFCKYFDSLLSSDPAFACKAYRDHRAKLSRSQHLTLLQKICTLYTPTNKSLHTLLSQVFASTVERTANGNIDLYANYCALKDLLEIDPNPPAQALNALLSRIKSVTQGLSPEICRCYCKYVFFDFARCGRPAPAKIFYEQNYQDLPDEAIADGLIEIIYAARAAAARQDDDCFEIVLNLLDVSRMRRMLTETTLLEAAKTYVPYFLHILKKLLSSDPAYALEVYRDHRAKLSPSQHLKLLQKICTLYTPTTNESLDTLLSEAFASTVEPTADGDIDPYDSYFAFKDLLEIDANTPLPTEAINKLLFRLKLVIQDFPHQISKRYCKYVLFDLAKCGRPTPAKIFYAQNYRDLPDEAIADGLIEVICAARAAVAKSKQDDDCFEILLDLLDVSGVRRMLAKTTILEVAKTYAPYFLLILHKAAGELADKFVADQETIILVLFRGHWCRQMTAEEFVLALEQYCMDDNFLFKAENKKKVEKWLLWFVRIVGDCKREIGAPFVEKLLVGYMKSVEEPSDNFFRENRFFNFFNNSARTSKLAVIKRVYRAFCSARVNGTGYVEPHIPESLELASDRGRVRWLRVLCRIVLPITPEQQAAQQQTAPRLRAR